MLISSICDNASVSFLLSVEHLENLSFQTCWNSSLKCPLLSAFLLRTIDCVNTEPQFLDISQQTPSHHQLAVLYSESLWHINGLWLCTFVEVDLIFFPHMLCYYYNIFLLNWRSQCHWFSSSCYLCERITAVLRMCPWSYFLSHLCSWYLSNTEPADSF